MCDKLACDKCKELLQTDWISHVPVKVIKGEITCFVLICPETQAFQANKEHLI